MRYPLPIVRSGYVYRYNGSARYLGRDGYNWSGTATPVYGTGVTAPSGYLFHFYSNNVGPSDGPTNRYLGFPIRCLAY